MVKIAIQIDMIPNGMISSSLYTPFSTAKKGLEKSGHRIISLEENAILRILGGRKSPVSYTGNFTREGIIYVPERGIFLTKRSPIMANAKEATKASKKGNKFYVNNKQVESALEDSLRLKEEQLIMIPTTRFGDDELTRYVFGEVAERYGGFLKDLGIEYMPIVLSNLQDKPFVEQVFFENIWHDSMLFCNHWSKLYSNCNLRGVRDDIEDIVKKSIKNNR